MLLTDSTGLLIDNAWLTSGGRFPVLDKFRGDVVRNVAEASDEEVRRAVDGACRAAAAPLPPARRHEVLATAAQLLRANADEVVSNYVAETGFTPRDATVELTRTASIFDLSAQEAVRVAGEEVPVAATAGSEHRLAFTSRVPIGVVGAIAPFNAPLSTVAHKVAPALAAGNAVVLKPAQATPLSSMAIAAALRDAGLPPGFLQLTCGPGRTVGNALVADRRIRYFTFTGSTATGLKVKQGSGIAQTHLELGANSASIVAADADLDLVVDLVARGGFRKAGQVCTSVQRLLVHSDVTEELTARLTRQVEALTAGDPRGDDTDVGPMISVREAERASSWVAEAAGHGARVLCGGDRDGAVHAPTLLWDPPTRSRVMTDEIFAPVVAVTPITDLQHGIDTVNAGGYGLQAGIFTQDIDAAFHVAKTLQVGGVMINDTSSYHADNMPYGGVKDSGYGTQGPRYAVEAMSQPRTIVMNLRAPVGASRDPSR